jgi:hypothetical protein
MISDWDDEFESSVAEQSEEKEVTAQDSAERRCTG